MRRYILTGTPGAGKTAILRCLEHLGYGVVEEAATAVIARGQARGETEPWTHASFIDDIVDLQHQRQVQSSGADVDVQVYDRSPICTHALASYLGQPVSRALSAEIERVILDEVYDREVFFVRSLGFYEPTPARTISFAQSLDFERVHESTYRAHGYELVDVAADTLAHRVAAIANVITAGGTPPHPAAD